MATRIRLSCTGCGREQLLDDNNITAQAQRSTFAVAHAFHNGRVREDKVPDERPTAEFTVPLKATVEVLLAVAEQLDDATRERLLETLRVAQRAHAAELDRLRTTNADCMRALKAAEGERDAYRQEASNFKRGWDESMRVAGELRTQLQTFMGEHTEATRRIAELEGENEELKNRRLVIFAKLRNVTEERDELLDDLKRFAVELDNLGYGPVDTDVIGGETKAALDVIRKLEADVRDERNRNAEHHTEAERWKECFERSKAERGALKNEVSRWKHRYERAQSERLRLADEHQQMAQRNREVDAELDKITFALVEILDRHNIPHEDGELFTDVIDRHITALNEPNPEPDATDDALLDIIRRHGVEHVPGEHFTVAIDRHIARLARLHANVSEALRKLRRATYTKRDRRCDELDKLQRSLNAVLKERDDARSELRGLWQSFGILSSEFGRHLSECKEATQ